VRVISDKAVVLPSGLSEEEESETGLYIPLNDDDDNSDTTLDKDENPVYNEDDLRKLVLKTPVPSDLPGSLTLSFTGQLTLWEDTSDDTEKVALAPATYSISDDLQSETCIWAEGIHTSSTMKDCIIILSYTALDDTTETDTIVATIAGPNLSVEGVEKTVEENTGAYIRKDKTRTVTSDAVEPIDAGCHALSIKLEKVENGTFA